MLFRSILLPLLLVVLFDPVSAERPEDGVDALHYRYSITLSDVSDEIQGFAEVTVRFDEEGETLELDLVERDDSGRGMVVEAVTSDGDRLEFRQSGDRLTIELPTISTAGDEVTVEITYHGIPADGLIIGRNQFGERTFFGDNWPNRARHWLPCVDHPSDKAFVEFLVTAPERYQTVANGRLVEESDVVEGFRLSHWRSTAPLPTKIMVIGVARFAQEVVGYVDEIPVSSWVYPENRAAGFHDFAIALPILRFFEGHLGEYPYAKLANVQSTTRYGGMENASAIFYAERAVTGERTAESTIAHEIAHQWFGNSVTETDWPHLWLSEGFATYLSHIWFEFRYGRDRMEQRLGRDRAAVVAYAATHPDAAVVDPSVVDPNTLLNPYSYQKGSWVLHMLRHRIGTEAFWDGLRAFYREFRDGNASTQDFKNVMEAVSDTELDDFFDQWLSRTGLPRVGATWHYDEAEKELVVGIEQVGAVGFSFPLEIAIHSDGDVVTERIDVDGLSTEFRTGVSNPPTAVELDPHTWLLADLELSRVR